MTWTATDRFSLAPAPGGLGIVQDLLNTRPSVSMGADDLLSTARSAQQWMNSTVSQWSKSGGREHRRFRLTAHDITQLRALRQQLSDLVRTHDGRVPSLLRDRKFSSTATADGLPTFEPDEQGWAFLAAAAFLEVQRAQQLDQWRRLKTCRNDACPGAFYDKSPNNSGVWHDVRTCGNVANLRALRARRAQITDTET